jgi:hypothetical protein
VAELAKPGRDPREKFEAFSFQEGVNKPEDLKPGMKLPGLVTNVTAFGAFVDIGVHQDGLVHVSQLADGFVKDPAAVVKPGQKVRLLYDAFPYQRFGAAQGTVEAVSATVLMPQEVNAALRAEEVREPVYRIDVKLDQQSVNANGQEFTLRPGMLVNADLLLERRTVFEWVFEPVLELRARVVEASSPRSGVPPAVGGGRVEAVPRRVERRHRSPLGDAEELGADEGAEPARVEVARWRELREVVLWGLGRGRELFFVERKREIEKRLRGRSFLPSNHLHHHHLLCVRLPLLQSACP